MRRAAYGVAVIEQRRGPVRAAFGLLLLLAAVVLPGVAGAHESLPTGVQRLELSLGGLVEAASELATRLGIGAEDRILIDDQTADETGPVAWLLAPLAAGASVVLCRHAFADKLPARAAAERVTATLGVRVEGVRELGRG